MSTSPDAPKFDGYYKWLGIPKREQPANHYRLLGLTLYESNGPAIASAADARIADIHARGEQKHPDVAERLIAEMQIARECLLNPEAKARYDEELKQQITKSARPNYRSKYTLQADFTETELAAAASIDPSLPAPVMPPPQPRELQLTAEPLLPPKPARVAPVQPEVKTAFAGIAFVEEPTPARPAVVATPAEPEPEKEPELVDLAEDDLAPPPTIGSASRNRVVAPSPPPLPPVNKRGSGPVIKLAIAASLVAGAVVVGVLTFTRADRNSAPAAEQAPAAPVAARPEVRPEIRIEPVSKGVADAALLAMSEEAKTKPAMQTNSPSPAARAAADGTVGAREAVVQTAAAGPTAPQVEPEIVHPFATARSFRSAWRMAGNIRVDYQADLPGAVVEGEEQLGGFSYRKPWREASFTVHAQTITGRLELIVNGVTLKFDTATVLIRKPTQVVIRHDAVAGEVAVTVGTRTIASAKTMEQDFAGRLDCELRCEGGAARLQLSDLQIKTR